MKEPSSNSTIAFSVIVLPFKILLTSDVSFNKILLILK